MKTFNLAIKVEDDVEDMKIIDVEPVSSVANIDKIGFVEKYLFQINVYRQNQSFKIIENNVKIVDDGIHGKIYKRKINIEKEPSSIILEKNSVLDFTGESFLMSKRSVEEILTESFNEFFKLFDKYNYLNLAIEKIPHCRGIYIYNKNKNCNEKLCLNILL